MLMAMFACRPIWDIEVKLQELSILTSDECVLSALASGRV